jgi:glycosyltransferase involved in cell wall biosynthesis
MQRLGLSFPLGSSHEIRRTAVVSIVAKNCLAQARVLMKSVHETDPPVARLVLLIDDPEDYFDATHENFTVVFSHQLGIANPDWFHFKYSILELSTAVKPFFLNWLFCECGFTKVIYLDPDTRVYASLAGIEARLETFNIVLTPHLTGPLEDDRRPTELQILRAGAYNLGFIALRSDPEVERFLRWWQGHLYDHCAVDLLRGLFVDQRWIDLVPGMFSAVCILQDPGYNVAYWNAPGRRITQRQEQLMVGDQPLFFFHFSGYDPNSPERFSKHQDRLQFKYREDLRTLCDQYRRELFEQGYADCSRWPYTHGRFRNGCPIPDVGRHLLDEAPELLEQIADPFSDAGYEKIVRFWNAPVSPSSDVHPGVTKLAYRVYRLQEDVQAAMPDIFGRDYIRFLKWMLSQAPHQHLLSEPLLGNVRAAVESSSKAGGTQDFAAGEDASLKRTEPIEETNGPPLQLLTLREKLNASPALRRPERASGSARLTVLARHIYDSRPDLQRVFPDPQGRDQAAYLAWLLYYGRETYSLNDEYLAPLRESLRLIRADLKFTRRTRLSLYCKVLKLARKLSPLVQTVRKSALRENLRAKWRATALPARTTDAAVESSGVNVYGYFRAETGVGQSARNAVSALAAVGIKGALRNIPAAHHSQLDTSVASFSVDAPYGISIFFVNADQTESVHGRGRPSRRKHNIGVWSWDLEELPHQWDRAFDVYDEIWVPSSFCQAAIAARSPVPVIRIPYCVKPADGSHKSRLDFGIDPHRFVFLSVFDMRSGLGRKNPIAAMLAFRKAFAGHQDCELIVKVNHAHSNPAGLRRLRAEASRQCVRVIDDTFRHGDVEALIRCADCVVSLHRSEGFGLVMAEAMLLGKPVIATGYSGNLDFTTPSTAFLVSYSLQRVGPENPPYPEHCFWANPCIDDAANQMRIVYENEFLRAQRAGTGRTLIEAKFSCAAVGAAMGERLRLIQRREGESGSIRTITAGRS